MDVFSKMVPIIHPFKENMNAKNVCVFVEGEEENEAALQGGAYKAGGLELITEVAKGRIDVVRI